MAIEAPYLSLVELLMLLGLVLGVLTKLSALAASAAMLGLPSSTATAPTRRRSC